MIILITGTRKGIGQYLAEEFLKRGDIVIGCSRGEVTINNVNYYHFQLDISNETQAKEIFTFIRLNFGSLDVLINNAGIASMNHFLLTTMEMAERIFKTNVLGTFLFSREAAKLMLLSGKGKIINFSSIAVSLKIEGEAVYIASKAAIESLTKSMAAELSPKICVNAIAPGIVNTDLAKHIPRGTIPETTFEDILKMVSHCINTDVTGLIIQI